MKKRLIHGDCLEEMKTIKSGFVDMVMCDPPFGTTNCVWDSVIPLEPMWEQLKRIIKPKGAIVLMAAQPFTTILIHSNLKMFKYEWIFHKPIPVGFLNANKQPLRNHENILVFYKDQPAYTPQMSKGHKPHTCKTGRETNSYGKFKKVATRSDGKRYPTSIIKFNRDKDGKHPTQKPVKLMEYLIQTYTKKDEVVLDFCLGSGTTGVACANTKRNFIGIEKDDKYFEIATKRILKAEKEQKQGFFPSSNFKD